MSDKPDLFMVGLGIIFKGTMLVGALALFVYAVTWLRAAMQAFAK